MIWNPRHDTTSLHILALKMVILPGNGLEFWAIQAVSKGISRGGTWLPGPPLPPTPQKGNRKGRRKKKWKGDKKTAEK